MTIKTLTLAAALTTFATAARADLELGDASKLPPAAAKAGVTVEAQYWTSGSCDGVLILSGAEKDIMRALTGLAVLGNVRTDTLRAYEAAEFAALVGK